MHHNPPNRSAVYSPASFTSADLLLSTKCCLCDVAGGRFQGIHAPSAVSVAISSLRAEILPSCLLRCRSPRATGQLARSEKLVFYHRNRTMMHRSLCTCAEGVHPRELIRGQAMDAPFNPRCSEISSPTL